MPRGSTCLNNSLMINVDEFEDILADEEDNEENYYIFLKQRYLE